MGEKYICFKVDNIAEIFDGVCTERNDNYFECRIVLKYKRDIGMSESVRGDQLIASIPAGKFTSANSQKEQEKKNWLLLPLITSTVTSLRLHVITATTAAINSIIVATIYPFKVTGRSFPCQQQLTAPFYSERYK